MLGFLSNKIGGLVRDLEVAVTETVTYAYEEFTSIPDELAKGYESGLISGDSAESEADGVTPSPKPEKTPDTSDTDTPTRTFGK